MKNYDHKKIEKKWQNEWDKKKLYQASNKSKKPKYYSLVEFPYPSGDGLHVGHPRPYIGMDVISRKKRMEGFNVLYPIGWDAFGLPTENYAIKTGLDPRVVTKKNTDNFRKQIKSIGISFDWSREINTTDPKYYKWTQWLFLQFLRHKLAYKAKMNINWCPKDKTGLANEEVVGGACERCGTPVEKREKEQWMLAITKYAERLDKDLDEVDYLPQIKLAQRNWIGRSEGAEIDFAVKGSREKIKVFTTRPDTIYGATYVVLAPEHPLLLSICTKDQKNYVIDYVTKTKNKTDIERLDTDKNKTGVFTGGYAVNPATAENIPIWVADYVLSTYGTGAIMAVPADDDRDKEFAQKFNLPIVENYKKAGIEDFGKKITRFKLRDWVFSRQRYWGEPIPVIHCESCGMVPVPEKDLPVELPKVKNYAPTDSGESPLANIDKWVNTKCPQCKGKAKRETDTMPNWAGSSWYFLRYMDPKNAKAFAGKDALNYWNQIDWYNGGNEHTTLHLLYSRFWHKFLFDLRLVPTSEPYKKRTSHGLILGEGGIKMSKSLGNVVNPNDIVDRFGADTFRLFIVFMGPFEQAIPWNEESIVGSRRFLEKVWRLQEKVQFKISSSPSLGASLNRTIKKVSEDIESMKFNTAVSGMMMMATTMEKADYIAVGDYRNFLKLLAPFAPHITDELWKILGEKGSIHQALWPKWDESLMQDEEIKIVIQVNGKVRGEINVSSSATEDQIKEIALGDVNVLKHLNGLAPKKVIYVKGRLINIVV